MTTWTLNKREDRSVIRKEFCEVVNFFADQCARLTGAEKIHVVTSEKAAHCAGGIRVREGDVPFAKNPVDIDEDTWKSALSIQVSMKDARNNICGTVKLNEGKQSSVCISVDDERLENVKNLMAQQFTQLFKVEPVKQVVQQPAVAAYAHAG